MLALVCAEVVVRLIGVSPPPRPLYYTSSGIEVPLGEFIAYMAKMNEIDWRHNVNQEPPHGLLLANLKLRMGYSPLPRWDYFDEHGCVSVANNSLGLRDEEFAVEKRPGELRILALGDSMTYGMGVRLDLTWPQLLEAELRARLDRPVEVINAGFAAGGHTAAVYHAWVHDNGIHFEPDVVVLGLCLNDVHPGIGMLTYPAVQLEPVMGGFSLMLDRIVQVVKQRRVRAMKRDLGKLVDDQTPTWVATRNGLRALRDRLEAADIPLVVFVFPMLSQLEPELYPLRAVHRRVVEFCEREGIRCVDLRPVFLGRDEEELWVHSSDQHANHLGHAIQAEQIQAWLQQQGLLGPR